MTRILTFLLVLAVSTGANAQSFSLKGSVQNEDKRPLRTATITMRVYNDTSVVFRTVTDNKGAFEFKELPAKIYRMTASYVGYDSLEQTVTLTDTSKDLGVLVLYKNARLLNQVVVQGITPPVTQKADTIEYNANQFKVNPDAEAEDLIKKMPGITVDKSGAVTAHGENVQKITVDGKDFFGDDATAALRNLPAEIIDKIQVFDRMSDQGQFTGFDDGNSIKAINIVTKSGIKNGQFGRIFAGYGTDDTYAAGGNVSFFNGDRRLSLVGNFNNVNQQNFGDQDLLGITSSNGGGRGFGGGNFGGGNRGGGRGGGGNRGGFGGFGGGENFTVGQQPGISTTNSIGLNYGDKWSDKINVTGSYFFNNRNNDNDQLLKSRTTYPDGIQYVNQASSTASKNYNHRFNMRFEYKIDSSNSLIISPSLNFQKNRSVSNSITEMLFEADTTSLSDVTNLSERNGYNLRNNILYRHSFAKRGRTFSVNLNTTFNKNDGENYITGNYRFFESGVFDRDSAQDQFTTNPTNGYTIAPNIAYTEPIGKKGQ
ncbi:MAG TPA: carboxypeptidase regulatory-like domain-containing protein, partial [Chitinophagaceae bacterium]|nr:carboxypeptidase regulatory-like domain-containing protein [Chitinophagaceae bacterium]